MGKICAVAPSIVAERIAAMRSVESPDALYD
jgi:hypothetical protein